MIRSNIHRKHECTYMRRLHASRSGIEVLSLLWVVIFIIFVGAAMYISEFKAHNPEEEDKPPLRQLSLARVTAEGTRANMYADISASQSLLDSLAHLEHSGGLHTTLSTSGIRNAPCGTYLYPLRSGDEIGSLERCNYGPQLGLTQKFKEKFYANIRNYYYDLPRGEFATTMQVDDHHVSLSGISNDLIALRIVPHDDMNAVIGRSAARRAGYIAPSVMPHEVHGELSHPVSPLDSPVSIRSLSHCYGAPIHADSGDDGPKYESIGLRLMGQTPIRAVEHGVVVDICTSGVCDGAEVVVKHNDYFYTKYAGLHADTLVYGVGETVPKGGVIGHLQGEDELTELSMYFYDSDAYSWSDSGKNPFCFYDEETLSSFQLDDTSTCTVPYVATVDGYLRVDVEHPEYIADCNDINNPSSDDMFAWSGSDIVEETPAMSRRITSRELAWTELATRYAERQGIPAELLLGVMSQESAGDEHAISACGAVGLMQFVSTTARRSYLTHLGEVTACGCGSNCQCHVKGTRFACKIGEDWRFDSERSLEAGSILLRELSQRYDGYVPHMLVGYNAGEGIADQFSKLPECTRFYNHQQIMECIDKANVLLGIKRDKRNKLGGEYGYYGESRYDEFANYATGVISKMKKWKEELERPSRPQLASAGNKVTGAVVSTSADRAEPDATAESDRTLFEVCPDFLNKLGTADGIGIPADLLHVIIQRLSKADVNHVDTRGCVGYAHLCYARAQEVSRYNRNLIDCGCSGRACGQRSILNCQPDNDYRFNQCQSLDAAGYVLKNLYREFSGNPIAVVIAYLSERSVAEQFMSQGSCRIATGSALRGCVMDAASHEHLDEETADTLAKQVSLVVGAYMQEVNMQVLPDFAPIVDENSFGLYQAPIGFSSKAAYSLQGYEDVAEFVANTFSQCNDHIDHCFEEAIIVFNDNENERNGEERAVLTSPTFILERDCEQHPMFTQVAEGLLDCFANGQSNCHCEIDLSIAVDEATIPALFAAQLETTPTATTLRQKYPARDQPPVVLPGPIHVADHSVETSQQVPYVNIYSSFREQTTVESGRQLEDQEDASLIGVVPDRMILIANDQDQEIPSGEVPDGAFYAAPIHDYGFEFPQDRSSKLYVFKNSDESLTILESKPPIDQQCFIRKHRWSLCMDTQQKLTRLTPEGEFVRTPSKIYFGIQLRDTVAPSIVAGFEARNFPFLSGSIMARWVKNPEEDVYGYKLLISSDDDNRTVDVRVKKPWNSSNVELASNLYLDCGDDVGTPDVDTCALSYADGVYLTTESAAYDDNYLYAFITGLDDQVEYRVSILAYDEFGNVIDDVSQRRTTRTVTPLDRTCAEQAGAGVLLPEEEGGPPRDPCSGREIGEQIVQSLFSDLLPTDAVVPNLGASVIDSSGGTTTGYCVPTGVIERNRVKCERSGSPPKLFDFELI